MRDLHDRAPEGICPKCHRWHHPRKACDVGEDDAQDGIGTLGRLISGQDADRLRKAAGEQAERERWQRQRQEGDD